ncbi:3TM-type holin [Rhizobium favelukesii]|uniref:Conserved protein n=1 Tax=Rhizobium favelukesii TaxID=348824 RepID=W6R8X6_9HYPH|nr:3TM-type holin [Rhizobium favelukesii]MCS0459326.1 holin family protein [Rhizobium favelukesii]CDM57374.1 putative conserved protein [Rhizobium favelukesii]
MPIAILLPILAQIGAPILKKLLTDTLPDGLAKDLSGQVLDTIAGKLGVEPTAEAIKAAHDSDPDAVTTAVKETEAQMSTLLVQGRDGLLAREDARGNWFSWAWRPAMSWLMIWMWTWNTTILPFLNAAFKSALPAVPYDTLISFCGIWLVIYGGGHTLKSVFGKAV